MPLKLLILSLIRKFLFSAVLLCFCGLRTSYAEFSDEIAVGKDDVWRATREVLESGGLRKENEDAGNLVTKWKEDRVSRSRGFFGKFMKQDYLRRYRLKVKIREGYYSTHVSIQGDFQEKRTGLPPAVPWRKIRPERADYLLERNTFMKILQQLEKNQTTQPANL